MKFHTKTTVTIFILVSLIVISRIWNLDVRPFHHDESMYAYYSYNYAKTGNYTYNPMLHGPFLFHISAGIFKIFGDSDFKARIIAAIFGTLILLIPIFFRKLFNKKALIIFIALAATSPLITYYSRFLRHDAIELFFILCFILSAQLFFIRREEKFLFLTFIFASLAICTKENAYLHIILAAAFAGPYLLWNKRHIPLTPLKSTLTALAAAVFIFAFFYSSIFKNPTEVLNALPKAIAYWSKQNQMRRIRGPFHYHMLMMFIYELPVLICFFVYAIKNIARNITSLKTIAAFVLTTIGIILCGKYNITPDLPSLHMDSSWHTALFASILLWGAYLTKIHLRKNEIIQGFWAFYAVSTLLMYSYLGEKVPWLTLYPLLTLLMYIASCETSDKTSVINSIGDKKYALITAAVIMISLNTANTVRSSFVLYNDPRERLLDMAYVPHVRSIIKEVNIYMKNRHYAYLTLYEDPQWPMSWYFRNLKRIKFTKPSKPYTDLLMISQNDFKKIKHELTQYTCKKFILRKWWVPDNKKINLKKFTDYWIYRKIFSQTGDIKSVLCLKK